MALRPQVSVRSCASKGPLDLPIRLRRTTSHLSLPCRGWVIREWFEYQSQEASFYPCRAGDAGSQNLRSGLYHLHGPSTTGLSAFVRFERSTGPSDPSSTDHFSPIPAVQVIVSIISVAVCVSIPAVQGMGDQVTPKQGFESILKLINISKAKAFIFESKRTK